MRLTTHDAGHGDGPRPAVLDRAHERLLDLGELASVVPSVKAILAGGVDAQRAVQHVVDRAGDGDWIQVSATTLLPPVPDPGKIVCLGRNYAEHAAEGDAEVPDFPMYFLKPSTCLLGAGGTIVVPTADDRVDYEGELVVVIGRHAKEVPVDEALAVVGGYTIGNDVSARTWQRRTSQFAAGKMADTFGPTGPAVVTVDEVPDAGALRIATTLNGTVMQDGNTADMVFDIATIIADLSRMTTLEPGDLIFTGTPEGVGYARTPPVWMTPGDVVSVIIDGLGELTNPVG